MILHRTIHTLKAEITSCQCVSRDIYIQQLEPVLHKHLVCTVRQSVNTKTPEAVKMQKKETEKENARQTSRKLKMITMMRVLLTPVLAVSFDCAFYSFIYLFIVFCAEL